MSTIDFAAIDVHAHYGVYSRLHFSKLENDFMTGDGAVVAARAAAVNVEKTIVSPLLGLIPRGDADSFKGNEEAAEVVANSDSLLQYVIVNPLQPETYEQARQMLQLPKAVGIKLHPEEHLYSIVEHGAKLFEFAAEHRALVLVHSGDERSEPADFIPMANEFSDVSVILAHLGNGGRATGDPTKQVRAVQASRHGNVYIDTSSARSLLPGLVEWAVAQVGPDRILFGTDTPLYFTACQRARIDHAELDDDVKRQILRYNAVRLLQSHGTTV